jgi:hypothetical protein
VIAGDLPGKQTKLVLAWAELHQDELMANWRLVMNGDVRQQHQPLMDGPSEPMIEKLFNLFLFVTGNIIHEIGAVCHEQAGSDAQKLAFLQSQVAADFPAAKRYPVPDRYILAGDRGAAVPGGLHYQS